MQLSLARFPALSAPWQWERRLYGWDYPCIQAPQPMHLPVLLLFLSILE